MPSTHARRGSDGRPCCRDDRPQGPVLGQRGDRSEQAVYLIIRVRELAVGETSLPIRLRPIRSIEQRSIEDPVGTRTCACDSYEL